MLRLRFCGFQVEVFWDMMPCNVVVGYLCFGELCWLHAEGEGRRSSKTQVPYHNTTQHHNAKDHNLKWVELLVFILSCIYIATVETKGL